MLYLLLAVAVAVLGECEAQGAPPQQGPSPAAGTAAL